MGKKEVKKEDRKYEISRKAKYNACQKRGKKLGEETDDGWKNESAIGHLLTRGEGDEEPDTNPKTHLR